MSERFPSHPSPEKPDESSEHDEILVGLPAMPLSEDKRGHWEARNPDKKYLTHASHLGMIAGHLTDTHPDGWRFVVDRTDRRGKAGHIEYFVSESQRET